MVDFDTIDKYVAAVKRGGVAIQMKQFHNLDRFIEQVVYDFKEYADIDLTEEQKEYIAATVSGDESYEHLINKNGENEDLQRKKHTRAAMWSARWPPAHPPWAVRGCCGDLNAAVAHCAKRTTSCSIFVIKSLLD